MYCPSERCSSPLMHTTLTPQAYPWSDWRSFENISLKHMLVHVSNAFPSLSEASNRTCSGGFSTSSDRVAQWLRNKNYISHLATITRLPRCQRERKSYLHPSSRVRKSSRGAETEPIISEHEACHLVSDLFILECVFAPGDLLLFLLKV